MDSKSKVAGTFFMDGMLQGRVPDFPDFDSRVRQWLAVQKKQALQFDFAMDGANFSVLADDAVVPSRAFLPEGIQDHLASAFQDLVELVPPQDRMQLMSTLRSVEYRPGNEVQTLYVVAPPGKIDVQQRSVEAVTQATPPELTTRGKLKLGCIGLGVALVALLASSFFIDWKSWFFDRADDLIPVKVEEITVDATAFDSFITFERKVIDKRRRSLVLAAKSGPKLESAIAATSPNTSTWKEFLAIAAIKKGFVRCDMFDEKGALLGSATVFLEPLLKSENKEAVFLVPLPPKKIHRMVIGPS
jgi:hypothetical protein